MLVMQAMIDEVRMTSIEQLIAQPEGKTLEFKRDLSSPKQTGLYKFAHYGIDHNQYVIDGLAYQSNYGTGLHVLNVSSIPEDPTGAGVEQVGFFDIYPEDDELPNGGVLDFVGTWSSYAFFESGFIFVNTIERGAFVVKMQGHEGRAKGRKSGKVKGGGR